MISLSGDRFGIVEREDAPRRFSCGVSGTADEDAGALEGGRRTGITSLSGAVDADAITLPIATEIVDGLIDCSEDQIAEALRLLAWNEHVIVEGSAGLAYAGYLAHASNFKDQNNVVLLCGGNFDKATIQSVLM